ncbi:MAG: hypothetical protein RIR12_1101 [Bacteroidota bacterium]|jgi:hypothetical protein
MKTTLRIHITALLFFTFINKAQSQVPVMSSYPSVVPTIFLDFDGHTVTGTTWNYNGDIHVAPCTLDSASIRLVFERVAEDFRPFTINVTTDSSVFLAAPTTRRQRVILTSSYEWFGNTAGGVANTNTFSDIADDPCFVFTSLLGNNVKNIAEATSHEAGHTLGLLHQANWNTSNCTLINQYNYGQGTGETSWAPIMGVGYTKNLTTWNIGPDPYGCNRIQNDATIITRDSINTYDRGNGISFRPDDVDSVFATAPVIPFTANQFVFNGEIEKSYDKDMIRFTLPALKRIRLDALPFSIGSENAGSNLDVLLNLFGSNEALIKTYNPTEVLSAVIDTTLPAGTYYIKVQGTGNLNAPEYASMGRYLISAHLSDPGALPLRVLRLMGSLTAEKHLLTWIVDADEQILSQVLEVSADGRNYIPVNSTTDAALRAYNYIPTLGNGTLLYRLNVTFDNGKQYYSNIVAIKKTGIVEIPKLITSHVNNHQVGITSPAVFDYAVFDLFGTSIAKGKLNAGINYVPLNGCVAGMYIIRYYKDGQTWSDKFIKQ